MKIELNYSCTPT